ncbi:hypothetical protein EF847_02105 [Actinobacteria bacterium YIM 96077]|uniref:YCII-related domain-containing protein n=1 Tax=Phytoactinopolyspora halophila TaxID=1981511 RepID=A0A329R472_9ACTN|nr:YciI family protein [Phytoactinopolyspora halophila]AYY11699.1 hypothetical protein EF847_02105 [Actinobacteria bacterium YIM 96077]RAW17868.1 hypothetical protein DPM12_03175 [Phytoactinopolyspora halophila]
MKYMLMMSHSVPEDIDQKHGEMSTWSQDDIKAHFRFMGEFNQELTDAGELVDAQGLLGPDHAVIVRAHGQGAPVVSDGPFPESKEFLAGYWVVDVDSRERAVEIAARVSAAPGRDGVALGIPVEVRQVGEAPDADV